jgi:hypothetical protein
MTVTSVKLIAGSGNVIGTALVAANEALFRGQIDLSYTPPELIRVFKEYEDIVNGQMFSLLDDIEERIAALALRVAFDEGLEVGVEDVQVYPTTGRVSFKVVQPAPAQLRHPA